MNTTIREYNDEEDEEGFADDADDEEDDDLHNTGRATQTATDTRKKKGNGTPALNTFGTDLTRAAQEGLLDPVVGREREIQRLAQILCRRKKSQR